MNKAREALGDAAPQFSQSRGGFGGDRGGRGGSGGRGGAGVLGKRRRMEDESSDSDVDEEVKRIPMPRDTPPPFPKEVLDEWYAARRARYQARNQEQNQNGEKSGGTNANSTPLGGQNRGEFGGQETGSGVQIKNKTQPEVKTVYEAKPQIRDLRKEAVAFVPAAVRTKMQKGKGEGGLMEPEEMERLEKEGYIPGQKEKSGEGQQGGQMKMEMEEVEDEDYA